METITTALARLPAQALPDYYIWLFVLINLLWFALFCFAKHSSNTRLQKLQQSLDLELERRRKVYELKICRYEEYCNALEDFCYRHQNDYQSVFLPLFSEFNRRYQAAEATDDTAASATATLWFSGEVQQVTSANDIEVRTLDKLTAELTLSAADDVAEILQGLQQRYQALLVVSTEQMNNLVAITLSKNYEAVKGIGEELQQAASQLQTKSQQLMQAVRRDLMRF
ncbi:hypothetical protein WG68_04930 [Arsukibacterium ikkense]|uniref:Uncharacterized protein n=1 Tax=Arsukibacterium ikkense TaxID=336831 RepID=A0A0M2V8A4_9GAMM|nr:hypothetical protein [Arsukibacterium ikkense]KKO46634.1 hypothetical protein WG68_04930 [Arsukibacterium ikkense]